MKQGDTRKRIEAERVRIAREALYDLLQRCNEGQKTMFFKLYPNVTDAQLDQAIDLVERTVIKNEKAGNDDTSSNA